MGDCIGGGGGSGAGGGCGGVKSGQRGGGSAAKVGVVMLPLITAKTPLFSGSLFPNTITTAIAMLTIATIIKKNVPIFAARLFFFIKHLHLCGKPREKGP